MNKGLNLFLTTIILLISTFVSIAKPEIYDPINKNASTSLIIDNHKEEELPQEINNPDEKDSCKSLKELFDSLYYFESQENLQKIIYLQIKLASKLRETGNYKEGLNYFQKALFLSDSLDTKENRDLIFLGISNIYYELYFHTKKTPYLDTSQFYAQQIYHHIDKIIDRNIQSGILNILGAIQIQKKNPDSALILLKEALKYLPSNEPSYPLAIHANISYSHYLKGNIDNALKEINKCYLAAKKEDNLVFMGICLNNMSLFYLSRGDSINADYYKNEQKKLSSTNQVEIEQVNAQNLILEYKNKNQHSNIIHLESEKYYHINLNRILTLGLVALLGTLLFIYFSLRQNQKLSKANQQLLISKESSNRLIIEKKELEIKKTEEESKQIKIELENKKSALNSKLMTQASIRELLKKVNHIIQLAKTENNSKKSNKLLLEAQQIIKANERTDWWKEYHLLFNAAAGDFIKKLEKKHPDLLENDKRLAYLIVSRLSSKEIAQILHKSYRAIEMARHRLRQKLALNKSTNMYNYLNNL